jgi:SAM-dependent methyltransferase
MSEMSVADWWERQHRRDSQRYLSDTSSGQVWEFLNIKALLGKAEHVLEIGVGRGRCVRDVATLGCEVSALDISRTALRRVLLWTEEGYSEASELPSDTFDLAYSFLVAQHLTDVDFVVQANQVLRALKPGGVFAFQFADCVQRKQTAKAQKCGGVCRSKEEVRSLVEGVGGAIVWMSEPRKLPHGVRWYAMQVQQR